MHVELFKFEKKQISVVDRNGEPWFIAAEVCGVLGIDTSNLSKILDEDERSICSVQYTDQVRYVSIINESGLYSIVLRSRKPEAKQFRKWVTSEVIPSIRKKGYYSLDSISRKELAKMIVEAEEKREQEEERRIDAENKLAIAAPKAERYDAVVVAKGSLSMKKVGAMLGIGRNTMFKHLRDLKVFCSDNVPYRKYLERIPALFLVKLHVVEAVDKPVSVTSVTPAGLDFIIDVFEKEGLISIDKDYVIRNAQWEN